MSELIKISGLKKHGWIWSDPIKLKWFMDILSLSDDDGIVKFSLLNLGKRWGVSKESARSFILRLKANNILTHDLHTINTHLTICDIESYIHLTHDLHTINTRLDDNDKVSHTINTRITDCNTDNCEPLTHDLHTVDNVLPIYNNIYNIDNNILYNKDNNKKNIRAKKQFVKPTLDEVKKYFSDSRYKESSAVRFFNYYETGDWNDSKGNPVKNWKQKAQAVWFKPENSEVEQELNFGDDTVSYTMDGRTVKSSRIAYEGNLKQYGPNRVILLP